MDTKITLSFDAEIIDKAKKFADKHDMSLSRLTEYIYQQLTVKNYTSLEDLPISDWVNTVAEGAVEYKRKKTPRSEMKSEYYNSRKK